MKFQKYINKQGIKPTAGLDISRPSGWAGRGLVLVLLLLLVGCRQEDDTVIQQPEPHRVEKIVAVVAPLSANAYTKERLERTAQWFQEHFAEAQQGVVSWQRHVTPSVVDMAWGVWEPSASMTLSHKSSPKTVRYSISKFMNMIGIVWGL